MPWFWHGVNRVFRMSNPYSQRNGKALGICTAASLNWCKKCLSSSSRRIDRFDQLPGAHVMNVQMFVVRGLDNDAQAQCDKVGLVPVLEQTVSSLDEVLQGVKNTAPHVAIFWTDTHTMGYRYSHHEKEFFDVEQGLFRAKYTDAIKAKIESSYPSNEIRGYRVVRLA